MTGGIIVTHAGFAEGLKEAVEMIAGKQEDLAAIGLREGDGMETLMEKIREVAKTMSCKKIWLFCDMFGATPCNAGCMLASQEDYEVITGVSLPILLDFVMTVQRLTGKIFAAALSRLPEKLSDGSQKKN